MTGKAILEMDLVFVRWWNNLNFMKQNNAAYSYNPTN